MRFFQRKKGETRLRILANSDSPEDQVTKNRVRDAILSLKQTNVCMPEMLAIAQLIDPTARASRGMYHFGGYASDAVIITLGAGEGHNWWGILFPTSVGTSDGPVHFESFFINLLRSLGIL